MRDPWVIWLTRTTEKQVKVYVPLFRTQSNWNNYELIDCTCMHILPRKLLCFAMIPVQTINGFNFCVRNCKSSIVMAGIYSYLHRVHSIWVVVRIKIFGLGECVWLKLTQWLRRKGCFFLKFEDIFLLLGYHFYHGWKYDHSFDLY